MNNTQPRQEMFRALMKVLRNWIETQDQPKFKSVTIPLGNKSHVDKGDAVFIINSLKQKGYKAELEDTGLDYDRTNPATWIHPGFYGIIIHKPFPIMEKNPL